MQWAGVVVGVAGLGVIAAGRGDAAPVVGLLLTVGAAVSWAAGNVLVRRLRVPGGLGLTVWSALVVPLPLFSLSLLLDGPAVVADALGSLTARAWLSTLYTAGFASLVGYGVWNRLLEKYPASQVAPFTLLVPVVGVLSAWLVLGERPSAAGVGGGVLLVGGVGLVVFGPRVRRRRSDAGTARQERRTPLD